MKTFIIAAITADGFIGRTVDHLADWSTKEDKQLFVRLTKEAGVIVMGAKTFATIGRQLPGRRMVVYTHHPETVIAEGVETTSEQPAILIKRLEFEGAHGVAICGGSQIYTLFTRAGLIDEAYLSIEPLLFGSGIKLFSDSLDVQMKLLESRQLNDHTILLHYNLRP